jgi:hypothetical protein
MKIKQFIEHIEEIFSEEKTKLLFYENLKEHLQNLKSNYDGYSQNEKAIYLVNKELKRVDGKINDLYDNMWNHFNILVKLKDGKTYIVEDVHFTITQEEIENKGFYGYIAEKITHKIFYDLKRSKIREKGKFKNRMGPEFEQWVLSLMDDYSQELVTEILHDDEFWDQTLMLTQRL